MNKYLKKITKITLCVFGISLLLFLICFPIGVKITMGQMNELLNSEDFNYKTININSNVTTMSFNSIRGYIDFQQSENDSAYVKVLNNNIDNIDLTVDYIDENTAVINTTYNYNNTISLNAETIQRAILRGMFYQSSIIVYVPKRMNIDISNPYYVDHINYNNKNEVMEKYKQEQRNEEIERLRDELDYAREETEIYKTQLREETEIYKTQLNELEEEFESFRFEMERLRDEYILRNDEVTEIYNYAE